MWASRFGRAEVVKLLLSAWAEMHTQDLVSVR
jgi:hypothetical protein